MKKIFSVLLGCCLLASCARTPMCQAPNPILPLHYAGEAMLVYLTDYVPVITPAEEVTLSSNNYVASNYEDGIFTLEGDNRLSLLHVTSESVNTNVVILPALPVVAGMTTLAATDNTITVGFNRPVEVQDLLVMIDDEPSNDYSFDESTNTYVINLPKKQQGRTFLRVYAAEADQLLNDILVPLQDGKPVTMVSELNRHDDQAQVLYSLMIDRFENGNTTNDWKLNSPEVLDIVDYQGGDFAGITNKINEGWFDELGITTIWISPITQNPWSAWGMYPFTQNEDGTYNNKFDPTKPYTKFSGYHGYWPIYVTRLEQRFGTEQEFKAMLDAAHAHNMNVVLDYVANHMHIEAPTFQEHPEWHTDSILPDGRRNFELWDEARLTTWFDVHIPTLDLERMDVCDPMTDSALYWLANYDLDGFRHDACKHIPLNYWRMLGQKMAQRFPGRHIWMIGETYGDTQLIGSYVKTGMLPAQFDFNIYHTAIDVLSGHNNKTMLDMGRTINESLAAYGAHHTMGNISGNHDKCRFISLAGGAVSWDENDKLAGWTRHVGVTADDNDESNAERMEQAYRAAMLLEVINLTIPGVPCIYQGDEFGQAGANDPDNRGMMRFSGLTEREQQFRAEMENLIKFRRNSLPLLYGDYLPVENTEDKLVFDRTYLGETVRVTIDSKNLTYSIE